jgi:hypothetical protein
MNGTNFLTDSNETSPKLPAEYALQWFGAAPHPKMQEIAGVTDGFIRWIAENSGWDLTSLDGLTFTDSYVEALASIDRGKPGMQSPRPTVREFGIGSAMTLGVIRDEQLRFRIVVHVNDLLHLLDEDGVSLRKGLYTLAHELAHVDLSASFYRSFPKAFGAPPRYDRRFPPLFLTAFRAWDEYAASRFSAAYREEQAQDYEQILRSAVASCAPRVTEAFAKFEREQRHVVTLHEVHDACADVLVAGSYFAGHLAGLGLSEVNIMERLHNAVEDEEWRALISESLDCLEQLWKQVEWESEEVFSNLAEAVRKAIAMHGVAVGWRENEIQAAPIRNAQLALLLNQELDRLAHEL